MVQVLIVDDDVALRRALGRTLRAAGYDILDAGSVPEAVDVLAAEEVDVALVDLRLGGASGLDVLDFIQRQRPSTGAVLISAYLTADDHARATELGAVCALGKPLEDAALFAAIDEALEHGTGFPGSVHGLSLLDGLQMFHYAGRVVAIHLRGEPPGLIVMDHGEIEHAEVGDRRGTDALAELLRRSDEVVRTTVHVEPHEATIDEPFEPLLVGVMRRLDEERAASPSRPCRRPSTSNLELADIAATVRRITGRHLDGAWASLADVGGDWAAIEGDEPRIEKAAVTCRPAFDSLVARADALSAGWRWIEHIDGKEAWALLPIPRRKRTLAVGVTLDGELVAHRFRATMLRLQDEVGRRWPSPSVEPSPRDVTVGAEGDSALTDLLAEAGPGIFGVRVLDADGLPVATVTRSAVPEGLFELVRAALGRVLEGGAEASVGFDGGYMFAACFDDARHVLLAAVPEHLSLGSFRSALRGRVLSPLACLLQ